MGKPTVAHEYLWYYAEFCKENKIVKIAPGAFTFPDGVEIGHDVLVHALTTSPHDYFDTEVDEIPS
jgi:hypothetical protein|tara:strand:+ start:945 stop:1142 length:198 start_codon:yes stop_codon:yes gene_type:complete